MMSTRRAVSVTWTLFELSVIYGGFAQNARADISPRAGDPQISALQEVIVRAQKRSENVQRVPITISTVSPRALQNGGVDSVQALSVVLPSLQALNIANQITPFVRGVGSPFTAAGLESPVAVYVDGVYHAFSADTDLDFSDVSQVALLEGPQGTLFGRNATGGVLQITTREPSTHFEGKFVTSFDNYLTSRSSLFLTNAIADNVAGSMSLSYTHQAKGYGTNVATGRDAYQLDRDFIARGKVRVRAGDRTTINLEGDYSGRGGPVATNFRDFPGYSSVFPSPQPRRAWDSSRALDSNIHFEGGGLSLSIYHDFRFAKLTSVSAYRDGTNFYRFTIVPSTTLSNELVTTGRSRQFTQEIHLVSPTSGPLLWTVGLFYFYNKAGIDFDFNFYGPFVDPFGQLSFPGAQTTNSVAAFAQTTYRITPKTRITAGFRYTYDDKRFAGQTYGTAPGVPPSLLVAVNRSYGVGMPTWRLALDRDISRQVLAYVSYNRGVRSGGFNTTSTTNPPFKPEHLDAYEAGIKSQFLDNRVRLNVGGFYYDYSNMQVTIFNIAPVIINAASARNYGADGGLEARVTRRMTLTASADWLHARFTSFPGAPFWIPLPNREGAIPSSGNATGMTLPYSPDFTGSLGVEYDIPVRSGDISLSASDSFNSGFYPEVDNVLHQSSYHIVNASVTWEPVEGEYRVRIFGNNILDKAVVSQAATEPTGYIADYTNPPFVFGGSFTIDF